MKKIFLFVIIAIFLLCSCSNEKNNEGDSMANTYKAIEFYSGIYSSKNWESFEGPYQDNVIPDGDTAVAVATQIFSSMEKNSNMLNYVPQTVFFDEQDEVWIVSFWKDEDTTTGVITVGGECNIALQKKDGKVLGIWYGE